jgi:hypothetical protein
MKYLHGRTRFSFATTAWPLVLAFVLMPAVRATGQAAGQMLVFGSSSVNGSFGRVIASELGRRGVSVVRRGYSAAGLARPDFHDMRETLGKIPLERGVHSVMLYIGGNDAQAIWLRPDERAGERRSDSWIWWNDERWSSVYQARAVGLIESVCARGVQRVIVVPPADVLSARLQSRLDRVRDLLRRAAESSACGRFVSTTGDWKFFALAGEPLRTPDGIHMTLAGALRVWHRMRDTVLKLARGTD